MNREKLEQMARESGAKETQTYAFYKDSGTRVLSFTESALARFDELVRADERDGLFAAIEMHTAKYHEPSAQAFNNGINIALHCVRARGKQGKV